MNNFELLYSLFNQYLFTEAKTNIISIKYFFDTNPSTAGNHFIESMLEAIRDYDFGAIDQPLFQSILMKCRKTDAEATSIMSEIIKWKSYTKEQMLPAKAFLEQICAKAELDKIGRLYSENPVEYIKYIKNLNFQVTDLDIFSATCFSEIDINSVVAEANKGFIPSHYSWINSTFDPYPGYEKGQLVVVCAAPSVGKSLFMMSEALHMSVSGNKVLYVGLGDNKMKDFIVRLGAMYTGMNFGDVTRNLNSVYKSLETAIGDRLQISINPAGKVSADVIVEYVKSRPEFDVVIIDYDSNLLGVSDSDNMYNSFGSAYEKFTELTLMNKLVFVGSQTKISSWNNEIVNMSDVGESSRKQHSADMIIGIGQNINCPNHLHCIHISKSRRGERDVKNYSIRLNNGRFYPICRALYDDLKNETEKRMYTEDAIVTMNQQYMQQTQIITNRLQNATQQFSENQGPKKIGPNPFS